MTAWLGTLQLDIYGDLSSYPRAFLPVFSQWMLQKYDTLLYCVDAAEIWYIIVLHVSLYYKNGLQHNDQLQSKFRQGILKSVF